MTRNRLLFGPRMRTGAFFAAALLVLGMRTGLAQQQPGGNPAPALEPSSGMAPSSAADLARRCSSPLANLLPECQAARDAIKALPPGSLPPGFNSPTGLNTPAGAQAPSPAPGQFPGQAPAVPGAVPGNAPPTFPPQPLTQFQQLVATSAGQLLPIFGASLFDQAPSTFAPVDSVPVTADYVLGPGDEVLLRVWGQVDLNLDLFVDRAGSVFIPQVGNVNLAGLEFRQIEGFLRTQLGRVFRNFDLNVSMGRLRSIQIFVVGQARRPGSYTVSSLSTLVNALFASGGPSAQGSMRHIQLKRGVELQSEFDLYDLLLKGDKSKDVRLLSGDVVYIPPVGPQVAVAGSVRNAAIYELKGSGTVAGLIEMAGGLSVVADGQRATLERISPDGTRKVLQLRLDDSGVKTALASGDLLRVLTILPRFDNAVTLRGNVANPGRFPWHEGMRLRDIIPDKESLITPDYWKKRNMLGFIAPDKALLAQPPDYKLVEREKLTIETSAPEINWSYAVVERRDRRNLTTQLKSFNLGRLVLEGDDSQNLELQPDDVVTVFSQADFRVPRSQQTRFVRLEGEFNAAGVYQVTQGETLGQLVARAGGLTHSAYLYAAEFYRESTRVDQQARLDQFVEDLERDVEQTGSAQLGQALSGDESQAVTAKMQSERRIVEQMRSLKATGRVVLNLEPSDNTTAKLMDVQLEDGDRFVVPPRPATVNVVGAVYNQNAFLYDPSATVKDYLRQSGGPTRNADSGHMFVIRADGAVVPKPGWNPFTKSFAAERIYPGDSIIVPERVFKTGTLRSIRDWTQVFAQFALGAAAINVLK